LEKFFVKRQHMKARFRRSYSPARNQGGTGLLNPLATALDQDDQHNYRKDASNYSDEGYIVHIVSPFL
jgi:hypothetical protein